MAIADIAALAVLVGIVLAAVILAGRPLLARLAARNIRRRTSRVLIVLAGCSAPRGGPGEIGRAHVCTPVTDHLVCRLLLEKKKTSSQDSRTSFSSRAPRRRR